jgi:hypothetical protein
MKTLLDRSERAAQNVFLSRTSNERFCLLTPKDLAGHEKTPFHAPGQIGQGDSMALRLGQGVQNAPKWPQLQIQGCSGGAGAGDGSDNGFIGGGNTLMVQCDPNRRSTIFST